MLCDTHEFLNLPVELIETRESDGGGRDLHTVHPTPEHKINGLRTFHRNDGNLAPSSGKGKHWIIPAVRPH
jgi:hypothetical protein